METFRRYYACAYFYSLSDADGLRNAYASTASVLMQGIVGDFVARQQAV